MNPLAIAGDTKHAQHQQQMFTEYLPGRTLPTYPLSKDRDLGGVAKEKFRMAIEFDAQRQKDDKGDRTNERQLEKRMVAVPASPCRIPPEQPERIAKQHKGRKAAAGMRPHAEPSE